MNASRYAALGALILLMACASSPPGSPDAAPPVDAGQADAGSSQPDSGVLPDAGTPAPDAGPAQDAGFAQDAGAEDAGVEDAGVEDAGVEDAGTDGGSCPVVTVTPASATAGVDCDAPVTAGMIQDQVCGGQRIATGLYDETFVHPIRYEYEGDGSGNVIFACKDKPEDGRAVVTSLEVNVTLTGCEYETDDYYSYEGRSSGSPVPDRFYRVQKCSRWPFIFENASNRTGSLGQIGPPGVTLTEALLAHAGEYLWFAERDIRPSFYLVGARPISGPPAGTALCEAEVTGQSDGGTTVLIRKVSITVDSVSRSVNREVESKGMVLLSCP